MCCQNLFHMLSAIVHPRFDPTDLNHNRTPTGSPSSSTSSTDPNPNHHNPTTTTSDPMQTQSPTFDPMDLNHNRTPTGDPSSSTSSTDPNPNHHNPTTTTSDPMQSLSALANEARSKTVLFSTHLSSLQSISLADSYVPDISLFSSAAIDFITDILSRPCDDPLCHENQRCSNHFAPLAFMSMVTFSSLYLPRIHNSLSSISPCLSGFEPVFLANVLALRETMGETEIWVAGIEEKIIGKSASGGDKEDEGSPGVNMEDERGGV